MKILLTGGGSGGHFYPIIAVGQEIRKLAKEHKLIDVQLYYMAPQPYDKQALFENQITFVGITAGKMRRYFSLLNFFDIFRTISGCISAVWKLYWIYPDVVFGKGGYVSFPPLFAARILRIPVVIHDSDSKPGRVNLWAAGFARKIALSYPAAADFFTKAVKEKTAYTGNPVREELLHPVHTGAQEFLKLEEGVPMILVLGGSQGAQAINESVLDALPILLNKYQIVHQTGEKNLPIVKETISVILRNHPHKERYKPYDYFKPLQMRMAAGVANLVVSRAGSTIFEIAAWGVPSIIVPIPESISHDQTRNAYSYARSGAAIVIEQTNLTSHILSAEVERILSNPEMIEKMKKAALGFARLDAARLIANEIVKIGLEHEK